MLLFLIFILLLIIISKVTGLTDDFTVATISNIFNDNILISSVLFILLFCIANIINIPGWIFLVSSVVTIGEVAGGTLTFIAAIISSIFSFLLVDYIGGDALLEIKNKYIKKTLSHINHSPIRSIIILRLIFQTFPPLNYGLALSGVRFREYLIGTLIGLPLPIFTVVYFFDLIFKAYKNL
ncbi:VTT domain-containing protein [Bacteriovorax sp. Seq25_V]|uniref:VTT domain-containing protein n=1 Tax=Bacteriovorax sp. Seq25_V TaxID=1201288 RepID=UPI00038A2ED2|nr:VTT domain-containing protein [Bacteriovorax sp. Seq25_V]EQC47471.1 SNARE-like domain protein [Bacteriovorax sp. Seq25_V]